MDIQDYLDKTGNNPQTQTFTYDALDRLTSAKAENGTNGTYPLEYYAYNSSTGNLSSKAGVNYTYGDANHDHAVTAMGTNTYGYDNNGNQTSRNIGGSLYTLTYDQENRLTGVSGAATATFVYDGDGNRVKTTIGGTTTAYVGNYFEWTGSTGTMKKYYYAGNTRVVMRTGTSTLNYLLGDHLGSTAITTNSSGVRSGEVRYMPWGTDRYIYGTTPTTYKFTGQRHESTLGLYFYNARWYDAYLNRWIQPDSIIPSEVQGLDRYAYTNNNPVRYTDPSGHLVCSDPHVAEGDCSDEGAGLWRYNITLSGILGGWTQENRRAAREAAYSVGGKMAEEIGGTPWDAFKEIYGYVNLTWGLEGAKGECATITAGGCSTSPHQINFMSMAHPIGNKTADLAAIEARNNVVHELGHTFADLWYMKDGSYSPDGPYSNIPEKLLVEGGFHPSPDSARLTWRQHPRDTSSNEIFADMFLGWTFDTWANNDLGSDRADFMTINMSEWIR